MQIGEVIRKYRKISNMTQEEMANRLGVTAPAVNKWENGNSYPDIMLLAPISRLLNITLDTLLSYREKLTDEEVNGLIEELGTRLKTERYEEVFCWVQEKLELYPNCETLIWQMAAILGAKLLSEDSINSEKYEDYIKDCYIRLLESKNERIRGSAADSLFTFYLSKKEYEKAEAYLSYFSDYNPEKKRKQAVLFSKTNRINEAYKAYEELLFSGYNMICLVFHSIYMLAMQVNDMEKVYTIVEKQQELAKIFEMGKYHEASCKLELATAEKNADVTIETMEKMLANIDGICDFCKSTLYEHMEFKETQKEFIQEMKHNLLECFRDEDAYGFLKMDKRWQKIIK